MGQIPTDCGGRSQAQAGGVGLSLVEAPRDVAEGLEVVGEIHVALSCVEAEDRGRLDGVRLGGWGRLVRETVIAYYAVRNIRDVVRRVNRAPLWRYSNIASTSNWWSNSATPTPKRLDRCLPYPL